MRSSLLIRGPKHSNLRQPWPSAGLKTVKSYPGLRTQHLNFPPPYRRSNFFAGQASLLSRNAIIEAERMSRQRFVNPERRPWHPRARHRAGEVNHDLAAASPDPDRRRGSARLGRADANGQRQQCRKRAATRCAQFRSLRFCVRQRYNTSPNTSNLVCPFA